MSGGALWRRRWTELVGHRPGPTPRPSRTGRPDDAWSMPSGPVPVCVFVSRFGHVRCRVSWLQCHVFSGTDLLTAHIAAVCCVLNFYRSWIYFSSVYACGHRHIQQPNRRPSSWTVEFVGHACYLQSTSWCAFAVHGQYTKLSLSLSLSLIYPVPCALSQIGPIRREEGHGRYC